MEAVSSSRLPELLFAWREMFVSVSDLWATIIVQPELISLCVDGKSVTTTTLFDGLVFQVSVLKFSNLRVVILDPYTRSDFSEL